MRATAGTRAIVVGGGIGGLSTAIALRRVGIDVTVFERMDALREVGAGLSLWTNALKALEKLGVADAVRAKGFEIEGIENWTWRGRRLVVMPMGALGRKLGATSVGVHRGDLLGALAQAVGPEAVQLQVTCVGFEQNPDGVTVRFAGGREERADLLIGADGLDSAVRTALLGPGSRRYSGYTLWRAVAKTDVPQLAPGRSLQSYGAGSIFGILPLLPGIVSWYGTMKTAEGGKDGPSGRRHDVQTRFRGWHEPAQAVIEATEERAIARTDIYDRLPVRQWGIGRMTLLGDAAHPTTHTLGQGACMAIEDAVVLARCLCLAGDIPAALRLYERRRQDRTAAIVKQSWQVGNLHHWENSVARGLRDAGWKPVTKLAVMPSFEKLLAYEA